jgi:hypothetical protein
MIGLTKRRLLLAIGLSVAAASSVARAQAGEITPPAVPANIEAPEGSQPFLMAHAVGTQNYLCLGAGLPWTFIGPQATLFSSEAEQVVTHFLSPNPTENGVARATWQHSRDSSTAWALAIQSSTDPDFVSPGAIPWLLLRVVGAKTGPTAGDKISGATYMQRVNTLGGSAPAGGCPGVGARAFVPYEADYVFYRAH